MYIDLLFEASHTSDPIKRMELIAAYAVTQYSYNAERLRKPFNSILGETFELISGIGGGFRSIAEQVTNL